MELRHLRYFVGVAEVLHFSQAATRLRISQPTLSHQIRQLETELQTSLLHRTKRRVELTEAGQLFLQEAREILARTDRATLIARRAGQANADRLRVAVGYCMDQGELARVVSVFSEQHPTTQIELQTMAVRRQCAALRDEQIDIGFLRPPVVESSLDSEILLSEPLLVALAAGHRAAAKRRISLALLAGDTFILVPRDLVPVYHDIVLRACREAGFVPSASHEADHLQMVLSMVGAGLGVALVPAFARKMKPHGVRFVPLHPAIPNVETAVAWRRDHSTLLNEFLDVARQVLNVPQGPQRPRP